MPLASVGRLDGSTDDVIRTGESPATAALGSHFLGYLAQHPFELDKIAAATADVSALERTAAEHENLLRAAGLKLDRIFETSSKEQIIEASAADR